MSASSKYDLSSSSPDRPYSSGQRSSYSTASFDRSGSFRDSVESPSFSSLSNMARSSTSATKGDVLSFLQCLRFDPKSMIGDHKLNRSGDFKRLTSVALGIAQEDLASGSSICKPPSSPLPEDFRRLKAGLKESCCKARERAKIFSESLSVINKWFPSIPSRKRSRLDALSNDRPKALLQNDRSVSGLGINKVGAHSHASISGIESEQHKSEEKIKAVPNKRTRTSMVDSRLDVRVGTPARNLITAIKDKETLGLPNGIEEQADSRTLPIGVDSWDKSKMKKKRSGIKHDIPKNSVATNLSDGVRDSKQRLQQRLSVDTRPRLSDTHGFRPGMVNGGMGVGKADGITQESGVRASISRTDLDNNMLLHDRRDCPAGTDKERVKGQAINKINAREDFSSGSPTSNIKMKAVARVARSGSGLVPKLSPVIQGAAASTDWEVSRCTNKDPASIGVNNRKRSASARSTSPPVAQWGGQRPQKISRTARRTNLLPIVPSSDHTPLRDATPPHDATPYVVGSERRLLANSPQQAKLKNDSFSYLSESEESGAAEIKTKTKKKKTDEVNEKAGLHVQKMSTLLLPRKNKVFDGEGSGGGIRKRGRTGRTTPSNRSPMPLKVEKIGNGGTAKQLRTSILGLDKNESKGSRPATRKLSGRKPYPRQKHTTVNAAAEYFVSSNDGHEELLTAINGVLNRAETLSSPFWKKMEPYFRYISDMDLAFLKQQVLSFPLEVSIKHCVEFMFKIENLSENY
ncbi:hypothetical protein LIER_33127 [Lithospermum erythrorhizon]|uniref:Uncharacterized protein n=1 Tax=Lithospermum erythrorhizon TaxID=34254 RepID=A0AAV3RZI4_LITER